jgi:hypothetical protein
MFIVDKNIECSTEISKDERLNTNQRLLGPFGGWCLLRDWYNGIDIPRHRFLLDLLRSIRLFAVIGLRIGRGRRRFRPRHNREIPSVEIPGQRPLALDLGEGLQFR